MKIKPHFTKNRQFYENKLQKRTLTWSTNTQQRAWQKRNKNRQFREETVGGIAIQDYYVIARRDRAIYIYFVIVRATRKPQALEMSYVPANIR